MAAIGAGMYLFYILQGQDPFLVSLAPLFSTTLPLLQVSATDEDGPINSAITYSLIEGNQLGHFAIHPKKGELQVVKALDWEQVNYVCVGGGGNLSSSEQKYGPAVGPEDKLWSTSHPETSPDPPSVFFQWGLWGL